MRRGKPEMLVAILVMILLGSYVWYTQRVVATLRADAARSTDMYRRVFHAFGDTGTDAKDAALFELAKDIRGQGVPLIQVDGKGIVGGHANLPFDPGDQLANDDKRIHDYIPILQAQHK